MTYTVSAVLAVAVAVGVDTALLRTAVLRRRAFWAAYAILGSFQLATNGLLTRLPVFRYDPNGILGWRVVYAPVEDLLFGFAMIVVTLSIWVRLGHRAPAERATPAADR
jgi:lycopene cyclase domain-containing protein